MASMPAEELSPEQKAGGQDTEGVLHSRPPRSPERSLVEPDRTGVLPPNQGPAQRIGAPAGA